MTLPDLTREEWDAVVEAARHYDNHMSIRASRGNEHPATSSWWQRFVEKLERLPLP